MSYPPRQYVDIRSTLTKIAGEDWLIAWNKTPAEGGGRPADLIKMMRERCIRDIDIHLGDALVDAITQLWIPVPPIQYRVYENRGIEGGYLYPELDKHEVHQRRIRLFRAEHVPVYEINSPRVSDPPYARVYWPINPNDSRSPTYRDERPDVPWRVYVPEAEKEKV